VGSKSTRKADHKHHHHTEPGGTSRQKGEIEMKKLEKIMKMLAEAGYDKNCKMSDQPDRNGKHGLYINCRNSQYVTENDDGTIQMQAVGGSRYSYPHIKTAEECAKVMIEQCSKTTGDINREYRALWDDVYL
jgi:hypothetical protein